MSIGVRTLLNLCMVKSYIVNIYETVCSHLLRILAGLSNSFLTGNVYMADTAPNHLVASFKQIEVTSSQQPHMLSRDNTI